jgi:hypothetical protein
LAITGWLRKGGWQGALKAAGRVKLGGDSAVNLTQCFISFAVKGFPLPFFKLFFLKSKKNKKTITQSK